MLALVSLTSTVYPSLIGTRPPSLLFQSKHRHAHAYAHAFPYTHGQTRTYTSRGIMGTSGGAHPMHRQMFPGEYQRNHQRGFKQLATANTNTHTRTHTPLDCRGKGQIRWAEGTKRVFLRLKVLQHLRLTLWAQGLTFIAAGVSSTHLHVDLRLAGSAAHQDGEKAKMHRELFTKTVSVCEGQVVWLQTSPYNNQGAVGEDQYTVRM